MRTPARSRPFLRALAIITMILTQLSLTPGAGAQVSADPPDLAAMLLRAPDYGLAELDGTIVRYNGTCLRPSEYAERNADDYAMSPADFDEMISGFGMLGTCSVYHGLSSQPEVNSPPIVGFRSYVHGYEDEAGATDGFAFLQDESARPHHTDLPDGGGIGDQSETTVWSAEDDAGRFQAIDLTFRNGAITGGVTIWDYQDTIPDTELAIALAQVLLDRVVVVMDGEAPTLGSLLAPMAGDVLPPASAVRYELLDGESEQRAGESNEDFQDRVANVPAGAQHMFFFSQSIPPAEGDRPIQYGVYLTEFGTADEAVAWVDATVSRLEEDDENFDVAENPDVGTYGDASIAVTYGSMANGMESQLDRMYVAIDNLVLNSYVAYTTVPAGTIERPTAIQVACIEAGGCQDMVPVPEAFGGPPAASAPSGQEDQDSGSGDSSTRSAIARIGRSSTSQEDQDAPAGQEGRAGPRAATDQLYESDLYPYTIGYSDDWTMDEPQFIGDMELVSMNNGVSGIVIVIDTSHNGDVEACLDGAIAYIEDQEDVTSIEVMEDENGGPIEGFSDDAAFTAIEYEMNDGSKMALYAECRAVAGGDATMEFNQFVPLDAYGDQVDAREELLAGIQVDN